MIKHIVLFKMKKNVNKKQIEDFYQNLYSLKEKIPEIISVFGGKNISFEEKKKGFTEGFIMEFKDEETRNKYLSHKEHKKLIKNYISPIIKDALVFDFHL